MLYAKIENGQVTDWPILTIDLKQKYFPNTSLPSNDAALLPLLATQGIVPVKFMKPDVTAGWDEKVVLDAPVKNKKTGEWERKYIVVKLKGGSLKNRAVAFLRGTDWLEVKYIREVVREKTMTEEEFNSKYALTLEKRREAISKL